ncbi:hypothetical protein [Pseudoalteromonas denitrificans]|uniref:Extracellular solute-binding protein, family 3 n=1 Tax=Pseudoalteromonas denitrificans DSM 6059 TaxID=1123010 RepID=A0A1I1UR94_9GAMM|nr:hypothetical protein [Pseudoalteromonas denitrificans]SFD73105.1 hypothetical protein SAMN02745724_05309 [Pseudoalteromonas denitrificans DSM 6059]
MPKLLIASFLFLLPTILLSSFFTYANDSATYMSTDRSEVLQVKYYQRTINNTLTDDEDYWIGLLKLALDKSGQSYDMHPVQAKDMTHARLINSILKNGPVNIAFMGTTNKAEAKLKPILIPVFRGLMGYRVMMTTQYSQSAFINVNNITDLKGITFGLGFDWPDEPIMRDAGLTVITAAYHDLFHMLAGGRFSAISRAAHEINAEFNIAMKKHPKLSIDPNIILAYRLPSFFFVAPNNKRLANTITLGLNNAYRDGSFLKYFNNHPVVMNAKKLLTEPNRKWIWLENKYLSEQVKNIESKYWFK